MKKFSVRDMVMCALFAALTAVCSQIQIPLPAIPINLALFAVLLCAGLLRPTAAVLAMVVYVVLGLVGVPVFAGMRGGMAVLFWQDGRLHSGLYSGCFGGCAAAQALGGQLLEALPEHGYWRGGLLSLRYDLVHDPDRHRSLGQSPQLRLPLPHRRRPENPLSRAPDH